jgi:raffinose/stachyose/melibiose transport system substrate-binding protein
VVSAFVASSASNAATKRPDALTLQVWIPSFATKANKAQLKRFTKSTGIKFDVTVIPGEFEQAVQTKWALGQHPDVLFYDATGNWLAQLNPAKTLQDLSKQPFVKRTLPGFLQKSSAFQGKIYAALLDYPQVTGVFYNTQVFRKFHLKIPHSYTQLVQLCKTIKQKAPGIVPIYSGGGDKWPLQVLPFSMWNDALKRQPNLMQRVNEHKARFTDPMFVWGIQAEQNLQRAGCLNSDIATATYDKEQKQLMAGKAAMVFEGGWIILNLVDSYGVPAVNKSVGFFGLSRYGNVASWLQTDTALYAPLTGDSQKEAAARRFIDFATGKDYGTYLAQSKQFPMLKGYEAPKDAPNIARQAAKAVRTNAVPNFAQTLEASYGNFDTYLSQMIVGQFTPKKVAQTLQEQFEKSARHEGLPGF